MKLPRSLYVTIFAWFWLTLLAGTVLVLASTLFIGDQPLGRRWMRLTQDLYAHSAVDFYTAGGAPALARYLDTLRQSSGMQASLLDEHQYDLAGRTPPQHVERVLREARQTGNSALSLRRQWTAATPVVQAGHTYIFVIEVEPFGGFWDGTFFLPTLYRLLTAAAVAALCCLLLTRHIVRPLRSLQTASGRIAAGDIEARVGPAVSARADEFGDVARAFDGMADRVALLLRRRQEMLAEISHELRSPLTRWSVSLELLRLGETDVLPQMEADLERMNGMIGQILTLTRLDLQPNTLAQESFTLQELLEGVVSDAAFEAQPQGKSVELIATAEGSLRGDANLLRSCLENVVRNAVHYTAEGTAVTIGLRETPMFCEVRVTDHGPGVPEDLLPLLFEPFFRASEAREAQGGSRAGAGLGLAIASRVAEMHGGSITAANHPGGGLAVTLRLPRASGREMQAQA